MKHIKSIFLTLLTALLTLPASAKSTAVFATLEQMEAAGLTHELTEISGGTILVDSEVGSFGLAYTSEWRIDYTNPYRPVDFYQIKVGDSELFYPGDCVGGGENPTFSSYEDGVMSDGCVYMFVAKQTGWMTVFNIRFSPEKKYLVFENGTGAVPYTLGAAGPDYKINYCVPAQTSGNNLGYIDFNNINTDFYFEKDEDGNHKPKSAESVTGLSASDSCLGYLTFKVTAGNTYYVSGLGTKMPCKGFVFTDDATEPTVTFMATDELPEVNFGIRGTIPLMAGEHFESDGLVYTVIDADAKTVKTKEGYYDPESEYDPDQHPYVPGNKCEGEVTIPAIVSDGTNDYTVVEIGTLSFAYCTGLTKINIPDGLTLIGRLAFYGCTGLTSLKIPDGVTSIGYGAFCACTSLNSINIPDGVTSIENGTFYACKSLSSINIPNGVTMIDVEAFYCCGITSINIPYGVTSIGESAFSECGYLTSISIPESIQSIGSEAFTYIGPNAEITYLAENPIEAYDNIFSEDSYSFGILKTPNANLAYVQAIGPWNKFQHIIAKDGSNEPGLAAGEDFEYEGIWYTVLDADAKTVKTKAGYYDPDSYSNIPGNSIEGDITIPAIVSDGTHDYTVVEIGEYGFWGCSSLTSISIPSGVTSIGESAFSSCSNLTSINIAAGITSIGDAAFSDCSSLTSITLSDGMTSIGEWAFWCCSGLTSVSIPVSIISIGKNAFVGIDTNAEITYLAENPIEVSDIFTNDFYRSGILKTPNATLAAVQAVEPWNKFQHIIAKDGSIGAGLAAGDDFEYEGIWYTVIDTDTKTVKTKDGSPEDDYSAGNVCQGNLVIPSIVSDGVEEYTVVELGECTFGKCTELTSVTLPNTLTKIGVLAFRECTSLPSIEIPESVLSIEMGAFWDAWSLRVINIPESVVSIGSHAFAGCYSLSAVTIPASVTSFGEKIFEYCDSIKSVTYLASTPVSGNENMFYPIPYAAATLDMPNATLADIQSTTPWNLFKHIEAADGSVVPDLAAGDDFEYGGIWYTVIDAETKTVKTKEGVSTDFDEIASGNVINGDLIIPSVVSYDNDSYTVVEIGALGFTGTDIMSVSFPETISKIGAWAFANCDNLTSVSIPEDIQEMDVHAFRECMNLVSVHLPEKLTRIPSYLFTGCEKLSEINIPQSLISIGDGTFNFCAFTSLELPEGFKTFGDTGFTGNPIETLTLPASITEIGSYVFLYCRDLEVVNYFAENPVGTASTTFSEEAYEHATLNMPNATLAAVQATTPWNLFKRIKAKDGSTGFIADGDDFEYEGLLYTVIDSETKTCKTKEGHGGVVGVTAGNTVEGALTIPESVSFNDDEYKVIGIGAYGFAGNKGITSISLPESVTFIDEHAFFNCEGVESISFSSDIDSIGERAFSFCTSLTSVTLPYRLVRLEVGLFQGCHNLKTVVLPSGLITIGLVAFESSGVEEVAFPETLETIEEGAFAQCPNLKLTTLPSSVKYLGRIAFFNCNLTSISIPENVEFIGDECFATCRFERVDYAASSLLEVNENVFNENAYQSAVLYTPNATLESVQATVPWNKFLRINASDGSVVPFATEVTLNQTAAELKVGETVTLEAKVIPENVIDKTVTWKSDNTSVATVDSNGKVTAVSLGQATITATCGQVSATCKVNVVQTSVESVTLSNTSLDLIEGETATLTATVTPADATDKTVTWTSSDSSIATVSANGAVTALKAGTATITASSSNGKIASCTVRVAAKIIDATKLTLSQATAELKVGETVALKAKVIPEDATDKTITWKSDNVSVATVDSDGKVTAVSLGEAIITATCGKVTATCKVTVVPTPVESVTLSNTSLNLIEGESVTLTATVTPTDATDKTLTWTSSDTSVATVSANGVVTAIKVGSATVTATSTNGKSAICSVTVVDMIIEVTDLTLSQATAEMKVGETVTLEAKVIPEDATDKTVTWKSDNASVATVDSNGKVTAVSLGEATIIASCGNVTATCKVTVVPTPVESVTLSNKSLNLVEGDVATLTATVAPANATDKTVTWTSSDSSVAAVSANGTVTAVNAGTTIITATSANGKSASCEVTVAKRGGDFEYEGLWYTILDADAKTCRTKAGRVEDGVAYAGNDCVGAVEILSVVSDGVYEYIVVQIGYLGFAGNSITSVIIPQSVTSIGDKAFDNCNSLERISYLAEKPVSANEDIFTVAVYRDAILKTPNAALSDVLAATPWKNFYNIEAADGSIRVPKAGEDVEVDGIVYTVTDESGYTLQTKSGSEDGLIGNTAEGNLVVPETVSIAAREYTVTEIGDYGFIGNPDLLSVTIPGTVTNIGTEAFSDCERLTSLIWKGDSQLDRKVVDGIGNPNLLVYVDDSKYAPEGLECNIVAGGVCDNLVLTPGYPFTPVMEFTANHSEITKEFTQLTPIGGCAGWETLAIPFEPTEIVAEDGRQLVAFSAFTDIDTQCPFWLYEADAAGEWKEASAIHQGVPYLVSMPNNDTYDEQYCIHGAVKFSTDDETVIAPETTVPYITTWASGREFRSLWLPLDKAEAEDAMGLNVGIDDLTDSDGELLLPGSAFHADVLPRPLEAYVNRIDGRRYMPVRGDQSFVKMISDGTGLRIAVDLGKITLSSDCDRTVDVVTMDGILLRRAHVKAGVAYRIENLTRGIYIVAGRKITVK